VKAILPILSAPSYIVVAIKTIQLSTEIPEFFDILCHKTDTNKKGPANRQGFFHGLKFPWELSLKVR